MRVIDGEVDQPDPRVTWSCPTCRRVRVDEEGRLSSVGCAGDPVTGAAHSPTWMVATGRPASTTLQLRHIGGTVPPPLPEDVELARQVLGFIDVQLLRRLELDGPGWCSECGDLVEVDNPLRREVRHRRGCIQGAAR